MDNGRHRVLVVEDNPVTLKMLRITLEGDGFEVFEAADGAAALAAAEAHPPDLVVQDYVLPDMGGDELADRLRRLRPNPFPVMLLSGLASQSAALEASGVFDLVLIKPVEPSRLLEAVRSLLPKKSVPQKRPGPYILVLDDTASNRKLTQFRLELAGYRVTAVETADAALAAARQKRPDAILADVLMPGLDGFQFCIAVRRDAALADIPVVLVSSAYRDEEDRRLALEAGASDLVARTPDLRAATDAIARALKSGVVRVPASDMALAPQYLETLRRQVNRQIDQMRESTERAAIQAAALSLMSAISQILTNPGNVTAVLGDVLVHCLDAAGLSTGLLFLRDSAGTLTLHSQAGVPAPRLPAAMRLFGHPELLAAGDLTEPLILSEVGENPAHRALLDALGHRFALIVPFVLLGRHYGTLVLASDRHSLAADAWRAFGQALAIQFAQVIALGQAMAEISSSQAAIAESAARLKALMDHANDGIFVLSPDGVILEVNRRIAAMLECDPAALIGRHISEFVPSQEESRLAEFAAAVRDGTGLIRGTKLRSDGGRTIIVDFSISAVTIGDQQLVLSIGRDVTEQHALEQQFLQAQKMEAVGRLAAGVAHDFNNILTTILGYADLMRDDQPEGTQACEDLAEIEKAAHRAASLTQQLLAFSRQQILQPQVLDPNQQLADLEKMLNRLIGEDIKLQLSLAADTGAIKVDPGQLHQVILNLVVNARDAMPKGGRIDITTFPTTLTEGWVKGFRRQIRPGAYVAIQVRDSGTGIDAATLSRIFEPFFTTKDRGKGTGLGLSTVLGIVEQSEGYVGVDSEPGHGAVFTVYFPRVDVPAAAGAPTASAKELRGSGTILLIEDDAQLRSLAQTMLRRLGYTVLDGANGESALKIAAAHPGAIDLLITDVVMPGMSGRDLATELARSRPETRVLYMSGYTADAIVHHGVLDAGIALLHKPFTSADLGGKVRQILGERASSTGAEHADG